MPGSSVITGGTYLLELSSGYDAEAFYLDDSILSGYTTFTERTNLLQNPNFESNASFWLASGAGSSIARSATLDYIGTASLLWSYPSTLSQPVLLTHFRFICLPM